MKNALIRFIKNGKYSNCDSYPRTLLDSLFEFLRFTKVESYIPKGARLLDIGTGDGNFLRYLNGHIHAAVGIDAHLTQAVEFDTCRLIPGYFPHDFREDGTLFDVITLLATVEHIPMDTLPRVVDACWKYLKPYGHVVITVPHPRMDGLLDLLKALRLVEGFSIHEHYGFDPQYLPAIFNSNRWQLLKREHRGFGCNNLFIFQRNP